jgi:hypothetical protein
LVVARVEPNEWLILAWPESPVRFAGKRCCDSSFGGVIGSSTFQLGQELAEQEGREVQQLTEICR